MSAETLEERRENYDRIMGDEDEMDWQWKPAGKAKQCPRCGEVVLEARGQCDNCGLEPGDTDDEDYDKWEPERLNAHERHFLRSIYGSFGDHQIQQGEGPLEAVIEHRREWPVIGGVYFLFEGDDLKYIGRSKNVYKRLGEHSAGDAIEFDQYAVYAEEDKPMRCKIEDACIEHMNPELNGKAHERYQGGTK